MILAGITVATLTGDNGVLQKASDTKNTTQKASEKERIQVEVAGAYDLTGKLDALQIKNNIKKNITDASVQNENVDSFPVIVTYNSNGHKYGVTEDGNIIENLIGAGEKAPDDSNAVYTSGNYMAVIPAGFTVSDVKVVNETTGVVEKDETTIENGLVVKDGSNNDWVWIPVSSEDLAKMYVEDSTGWNLLGTSGDTAVNTKLKTRTITTAEETATGMILKLGTRALSRTNPGLTADPYYREPDVLSSYDTDANYRKQAGFVEADGTTASSLETMATKLKDDYKDMIDSVRENGGFYIGRYELGNGRTSVDTTDKPQVKEGAVMNNRNWYQLYSACKSFSNGNVESRMIWGCQWDQVCRFISSAKDENNNTISLDNSRSYGNYSNSTKSTDISGSSNFNNTTGRSADWKIKNLYDIAGNCWEWTQEAYIANGRACRGR